MGILQFYKKLVKKCAHNNSIIEIENKFIDDKWDYLFFDFQSLLYTTYQLFSSEINYFIRLIFYIRYLKKNNKSIDSKYEKIINYIILKYENYFIKIYEDNYIDFKKGIMSFNINIINKILLIDYNNEDILIDILTDDVIILVKQISDHHLKSDNNYDKTFIFFDGIPSKAKIKEQLSRKIYPEIIKNIKNDLYINASSPIEIEITKKLLSDMPPSIGINKPIIHKINKKLRKIDDIVKGKININNLYNYGEAEHQIMVYLNENIDIFKDSNILLVSPDADLILLSIINYTKNINIDIFRVSTETESSNISEYKIEGKNIISPFYYKYGYIFIKKLIQCLELRTKQEQIDISFILLLLGDDFLPIIPEINVNSLNDIITIYKKSNISIINIEYINGNILSLHPNKYEINYINFIKLIGEFVKIPKQIQQSDSHFIFRETNKIKDLKKFYFYNNYANNFTMFEKLYFLTKGIYKNKKNKLELIMNNKIESEHKIGNEQINNYLEGCQFIFDLYINNKIKNYNWVYKYETSPHLNEIYSYLQNKDVDNLKDIFNYTNSNNSKKFLSYNTYQLYIEYLKNKNIENILKKVGVDDEITNSNIQDFEEKIFIYKNINKIFECTPDKKYINKCIDIQVDDISDDMLVDIDIDNIKVNMYDNDINLIGGSNKYKRYIKKF